eukprot:scaffold7714_cov390-Prasinococcus_capsulatus_cf.AAC.8
MNPLEKGVKCPVIPVLLREGARLHSCLLVAIYREENCEIGNLMQHYRSRANGFSTGLLGAMNSNPRLGRVFGDGPVELRE